MVSAITAGHRSRWRNGWLSCIQELADLEMQRATWLNPDNRNPHYTFVECITCYFDDLRLTASEGGYTARITEGLLTDEEALATAQLHDQLCQYEPPGEAYDHSAILEDREWLDITNGARQAQAALSVIIFHPDERASLLLPSEHAIEAAQKAEP